MRKSKANIRKIRLACINIKNYTFSSTNDQNGLVIKRPNMKYTNLANSEPDIAAPFGRADEFDNFSPRHDSGTGFIDFWRIYGALKKWWWLISSIAALAMAITALIVFKIMPVYMASSVLEIKKSERQIFNASEVENAVFDREFFVTQIELLKSQSLVESVVDSLNLVSDPYFTGVESGNRDGLRTNTVRVFSSKLHISPIGRSRLIKVSFEHTDPRKAALIADAVADTFISYNLERKYNATSYARDFVEERLRITKEVLEKSERNLVKYASENKLVTVGSGEGNVLPGYLDAAALIKLDADLTAARTKSDELKQIYSLALANADAPEILESATIDALKKQFVDLNSEYLEKLSLYKPEYPEMIELQLRIDYLDAQIAEESKELKNALLAILKAKYEVALEGERSLRSRVKDLKKNVGDIRDKSINYTILKREVDTNRTQYDALLQRLKEVSISDDIGSNLISLVDHAKIPVAPFKPNKKLLLLLALIFGTVLGSLLVFVIEVIDDRIKSPDDIKNKLKSVVMGVIPKKQVKTGMLKLLEDPQSSIAEAYASLRTNLQFSGPNGGPKVIHVTSTRSGEGKSVTALGLALRFAGLNERTLLIDADMRRPTFVSEDGKNIGLSGLLTSASSTREHIQGSKYDNLDLLPSGKSVPNPSEILSTYRLNEILDYAREHYDHVIVDSPPVLGLADAPILAAKCDASILIVEAASIRTPAIKITMERLEVSSVKLIGVVLTKFKAHSKGYSNYYLYHYGENSYQYGNSKKGRKTKSTLDKTYIDIFQ